ncbi:MAG: hypothetical protein RI907_106 [Pseudomonadota bacterium]
MPAADPTRRTRLINRGDALLAMGDAQGALQAYEQAASSAHEARIELGLLRAQMQRGQAGDYRHALAFAAHTAGVHVDEVAGRVLYAWLLDRGAQPTMASQMLTMAHAAAPQDAQVRALADVLTSGGAQALPAVLRAGPAVLAPMAWGVGVPTAAQVVSAGVLLAGGRQALVPAAALPLACQPESSSKAPVEPVVSPRLWLRNGLGQTVAAHLLDRDDGLGVALLSLDAPLPLLADPIWAARDAFAGSPAWALDHAPDANGAAAWPVMRAGFVGSAGRLGVALPQPASGGHRGGPVFDGRGQLTGVALRTTSGDRLLAASALRQRFGPALGPVLGSGASTTPDSPAASTPTELNEPTVSGTPAIIALADAEAIYEAGLHLTLQLLVAPP